jgi:proteasome lid subunit RPN8/RPN11
VQIAYNHKVPESSTDSALGTWSVPECPFTIEYLPRVMDDIRLAVVDAFFSLPRGGAEIGGILLGRQTDTRVTIAECVPMECEHAMGPSFVLSAHDEARLQALLDKSKPDPSGLRPVGWYHSHTRSEILLSDADLVIHKRFFPEPWQIALVFKPHTFQPMRCGFFFRGADGVVRANRSYKEILLDAMPLRTMPNGTTPPAQGAAASMQRAGEHSAQIIDVAANPLELGAPEAAEPLPASAAPLTAPTFGITPPSRRGSKVTTAVLAVAAGLAVGAVVYMTRQAWLPAPQPTTVSAAAPVTLSATDSGGQLQIRWDRSAAAVQQGTGGMLTILDGSPVPRQIHLDADHLRNGSFTYERDSGQVDVTLTIARPGGAPVRAVVGFMGKMPAASAADPQFTRLKKDLADQMEENHKMQKMLADQSLLVSQATQMKKELTAANARIATLTKSLAEQQRKRMGAQDPGK